MSFISVSQSLGKTSSLWQDKADQLETFVDTNNEVFNNHIKELANHLDQGGQAQTDMLKKLVSCDHVLKGDLKENLVGTLEDGLRASESVLGSVGTIIDDLNEGAKPENISKVAKDFDAQWDNAIEKITKVVSGNASDKFIEGWTRSKVGDKLFDVVGSMKRGASDAIAGVGEYMSLGETFGGSWRNPEEAAKKITKGVNQVIDATQKVSSLLSNMTKAMGGEGEFFGLHDIQKNAFGKSVTGLSGVATGTLTGVAAMRGAIDALKSGNIRSAVSYGQGVVSSAQNIINGGKTTTDAIKNSKFLNGEETGGAASINPFSDDALINDIQDPKTSSYSVTSSKQSSQSSTMGGMSSSDDTSIDLVEHISVSIDGGAPDGESSVATVNGEAYILSDFSMVQELLSPISLSFTLTKRNIDVEKEKDVHYNDATTLTGKIIEVSVTTAKFNTNTKTENTIVFKGIIVDVSASRGNAGVPSYFVSASTQEYLLAANPNCRSFTDKTLSEIVKEVLSPYSDLQSSAIINPRYKEKIPYIVQYNESDYSFLISLAKRFGEWMYSTGEKFVFGEIESSSNSLVQLYYPANNMFSYSVNMQLVNLHVNQISSNMYKHGENEGVTNQVPSGEADGSMRNNTWTEQTYQHSSSSYKAKNIQDALNTGYDDGSEKDNTAFLSNAVSLQQQAAKTKMMMSQGGSKVAKLSIGQEIQINDSTQNKSGESRAVLQHVLMVIGVTHQFDYHQEYNNSFSAVPESCKVPPYAAPTETAPYAATQSATVVDNLDPKNLGRVKVQFAWQSAQDANMNSPWIRICMPYAGKDKGVFFVPEIGEEVMVGFEMNNAERPFIIGTLYNGTGTPDEKWSTKKDGGTQDNIKAIRTRNGHTILFNDKGDAGLIEIYDNKNNTYHITLSADDKKITIYSAGDIEINADGSISMTAKDNVNIKANSNVSVNADKEVSIQASKVKVR